MNQNSPINSDTKKNDAPASFSSQSLAHFTECLASKAPVPGGGGAAGLSGALGASLGQMVVNLTLGKKKYAAYEAELLTLGIFFEQARADFLALAAEDEAVFLPLSAAYKLPSDTEKARLKKQEALEPLLEAAARTPLRLMQLAKESAKALRRLVPVASRLAISDAAAGASLIEAAAAASSMNVIINANSLQNRALSNALLSEADQLLAETKADCAAVAAAVAAALRPS